MNKLFKPNPASARARALRSLFLAFAFLLVLVYAISVFQGWRDSINDTQASLKYISSLLAQATRSTFTSNELVLRGLGSELLNQGALRQPENGRVLIERMKGIDASVVGFGLARTDGQLVLVSGLQGNTPLPNLLANPSARESFQKSLDTKSFQIGRPYFMSQLNNWVVPIRVPLLNSAGSVAGVMAAGYRIEGANAAWSHLDVPKGMTVLLIRQDGYRILSTPLPAGDKSAVMKMVYGQPVAATTLEKIRHLTEPEGFGEIFAPQLKERVFYYYQRLPEYELLVASLMPRQAVLVLWLERMLAPTALFSLVMIGGYFAYRRSVLQLAKSDSELEKSRLDQEQSNFNLQLINSLSNRLNLKLEVDAILQEASHTLAEFVRPDAAVIGLLADKGKSIKIVVRYGLAQSAFDEGYTLPFAGSLTEKALLANKPLLLANPEEHEATRAMKGQGIKSIMVIPLIYGSETIGSMLLFFRFSQVWAEPQLDTLNALGRAISLALANAGQLRDFEYRALHDSLTGLANRTLLHQQFKQRVAALKSPERVGLFLFDLDHFKDINDTLGHQVGDKLLCEIGPRFESVLQGRNFVISRLGGDEFVVLVSGVLEQAEWLALGKHLRQNLLQPFSLEGMKLEISASVGVALYPDHGNNSHELMRYADVAMYEAKRSGAGILLYEKMQNVHSLERLALMGSLGAAIDAGELVLHYQPKLELASGKVKGFEALVRWQHPELGLLFPDKFIPMAETSDVIHRLTLEVLRQALKQQQKWKSAGLNFTVAVNLSARNLVDDRLFSALQEMMQDYAVEKNELELEITESALMYDPEGALKLLHQFAALGASLSIDDFGTGFSSMAYLRQMPVNTLKIDMLFVRNMLTKAEDRIIVSSMITLAHNLGMQVVAEGVEDGPTRQALDEMGCDQIQGYYISKPKPWHELVDWVAGKG